MGEVSAEGYVLIVADYRHIPPKHKLETPLEPGVAITYVDDGVAVVDHVRSLPYVDPARIHVYGVSLGGNLVLHLIGRTQVRAAVLGAPAAASFLGAVMAPGADPSDSRTRWIGARIDAGMARQNIEPIRCPILILVGEADGLIHIDRPLYFLLEKAGKTVRMEVYENGYHDFCIGPQGHQGYHQPLTHVRH